MANYSIGLQNWYSECLPRRANNKRRARQLKIFRLAALYYQRCRWKRTGDLFCTDLKRYGITLHLWRLLQNPVNLRTKVQSLYKSSYYHICIKAWTGIVTQDDHQWCTSCPRAGGSQTCWSKSIDPPRYLCQGQTSPTPSGTYGLTGLSKTVVQGC